MSSDDENNWIADFDVDGVDPIVDFALSDGALEVPSGDEDRPLR